MTHYIRQQYLDVNLIGSEPNGLTLEHHLSELYYTSLLPAIESVFDNCNTSEKLLVIDHLEINVGTIALDRIDEDLEKAVIKALMEALEKESVKSFFEKKVQKPFFTSLEGSEVIAANSWSRSPEENLMDVLVYFLRNGLLPWSYKLPEEQSLEQVITEHLLDNMSNGFNVDQLSQFLKISGVLRSVNARTRLQLQFSETFVLSLIKILDPLSYHELTDILADTAIEKIWVTNEGGRVVRKLLIEKFLIELSFSREAPKAEMTKRVLTELRLQSDFDPLFLNLLEKRWTEDKLVDDQPVPVKIPDSSFITSKENLTEVTAREIYIDNAGLVILHPFLPQFFEALGIVFNQEIVQSERALGLLHYLVTGQTQRPEYELVLAKILCNVRISTPINAEFEISQDELNESSALLDAVITHWDALRNTSQDGLRGTFLVRPGKLTLKDDGDWLLQVESRTCDILMEHLPWGISMIKLPWMKNMLQVEWG
jgi:hypothetical protein